MRRPPERHARSISGRQLFGRSRCCSTRSARPRREGVVPERQARRFGYDDWTPVERPAPSPATGRRRRTGESQGPRRRVRVRIRRRAKAGHLPTTNGTVACKSRSVATNPAPPARPPPQRIGARIDVGVGATHRSILTRRAQAALRTNPLRFRAAPPRICILVPGVLCAAPMFRRRPLPFRPLFLRVGHAKNVPRCAAMATVPPAPRGCTQSFGVVTEKPFSLHTVSASAGDHQSSDKGYRRRPLLTLRRSNHAYCSKR
jgi:hypothetical protein